MGQQIIKGLTQVYIFVVDDVSKSITEINRQPGLIGRNIMPGVGGYFDQTREDPYWSHPVTSY
jgi:hypothetical protein